MESMKKAAIKDNRFDEADIWDRAIKEVERAIIIFQGEFFDDVSSSEYIEAPYSFVADKEKYVNLLLRVVEDLACQAKELRMKQNTDTSSVDTPTL